MVLKALMPDQFVDSIHDIDIEALRKRNIRAIITDLDNTLVEWDRTDPTPEVIDWIAEVRKAGMEVTIVSNNSEERVRTFCQPLGVHFISAAKKPSRHAFLKAMELMDATVDETVVIGDQLFTDMLGGNLLGFHTILVVPVASTDGFFTRFNRRMERIALYWMRRKGMITWKR